MKCKTMRHGIIGFQWMTLLLLFAICFSSCKDDKDASAEPYDPTQPVTVTDFAPKAGGAQALCRFDKESGLFCLVLVLSLGCSFCTGADVG